MVLLGSSAWLLAWSFQGYLQVVIEHFYKRKLSLMKTSKSVNVWWLSRKGCDILGKPYWLGSQSLKMRQNTGGDNCILGMGCPPNLFGTHSQFLQFPTRWAPTIVTNGATTSTLQLNLMNRYTTGVCFTPISAVITSTYIWWLFPRLWEPAPLVATSAVVQQRWPTARLSLLDLDASTGDLQVHVRCDRNMVRWSQRKWRI